MSGTPASMDPFTLEVLRHAFSAIAEEMSLVVMRSARSPLLREAGDLSSAVTDARGELVAQGRDIPMHMGVMSFTVKEFLKRVPAERLHAGDVWFLNLPEIGGNHLPDVKARGVGTGGGHTGAGGSNARGGQAPANALRATRQRAHRAGHGPSARSRRSADACGFEKSAGRNLSR